ncbi:hypothetical protein [Longitalea luteola]|uniref:hypothetical protein n=1 Tax=Longitalea luteola TaxID=2812563 RepID=UPI001A966067|nr:hypothetical protein [Longitalea luteola]
MKKAFFSVVAITAAIIAGCSKDDDGGGPEKDLLGKWTPVSTKVVVSDIKNGGSTTTDKPVYPGDYIDFRSDGKVYTRTTDPQEAPGYDPNDTLTYRLTTTYLIIDGDSCLISKLTKDSLTYILQEKTEDELWETIISLKK